MAIVRLCVEEGQLAHGQRTLQLRQRSTFFTAPPCHKQRPYIHTVTYARCASFTSSPNRSCGRSISVFPMIEAHRIIHAKEGMLRCFSIIEFANRSAEVLKAAEQAPIAILSGGKPRYIMMSTEEFEYLTRNQRAA